MWEIWNCYGEIIKLLPARKWTCIIYKQDTCSSPQENNIRKSKELASRITPNESTVQSPYLLVYGKEYMLPVNVDINALSMACQVEDLDEIAPLQSRYLE